MRSKITYFGWGYLPFFTLILLMTASCHSVNNEAPIFEVLDAKHTGIEFSNDLHPNQEFNMFHYMYYYNGAGVGTGDFNNDGKVDIFFASNEGKNKLYLNKGEMHFEDVTSSAQIPQDSAWNTGVSIVDINNDGLLDIYICRLGNFFKFKDKNQLLVCQGLKNGVPYYKDEAANYGLDFSGLSTQAAFVDYDQDGDLDVFLLNHSIHQNGTFAPREHFVNTYDLLSGDRIFKNDNGHFTDITKQTKINSSAISYGLGIVVSDLNYDGYPDIYAGNDFHENDYLYINQKNGTFRDEQEDRMMHTSQYSMGVDAADLDNDGFSEIVSMDMLPKDPYILKRSLGEDDYDIYKYKIGAGYGYQFTRNNLQWNRRNGHYSEVGMYAGIYATDWSWATLLMDFNNDGLKDVFIANGIPKRMNDMDYVNFISNQEIQEKIKDGKMGDKDMALVEHFPEIKIPNQFFVNQSNLSFSDKEKAIKGNPPSYSNGAAYADLDNDGDLDLVVNNVNDKSFIYRNTVNDQHQSKYASVALKGPASNINALGTKVILFANGGIRTYEKYPVRGFLSSMEIPMLIGLDNTKVDSAFLVWPDNTYQKLNFTSLLNKQSVVTYTKGLPKFDYNIVLNHWNNPTYPILDITKQTGIDFVHQENVFQEFNREQLIPQMNSTEGPAVAVADINHDGLEDIYLGAARGFERKVFLQQANGKFTKLSQPALALESNYEDVCAVWADVNADGNVDLVVGSGGNEYFGQDKFMMPRVYLNNGKGLLATLENAIPIYNQSSSIVAQDFNKDGKMDLLITSRVVSNNYGLAPDAYVLYNQGDGHFKNVTSQIAPFLNQIGFITSANSVDIEKDGLNEIILTHQWGGIDVIHTGKKWEKSSLTDLPGWWNFTTAVDIDQDGDLDIVAGNLGLNTRLNASEEQPIKMYYNDFDDNGTKEQIVTYFVQNKEIPFANKDEIQRQIPLIKKKFLYAEDFAKAKLTDIFSSDKLKKATTYTSYHFANTLFINDGKGHFTASNLPWQAQMTTYKTALVVDANGDALPDVMLMGNFYENNVQMGRYDADYGLILVNKGKGRFETQTLKQCVAKGQIRHLVPLHIGSQNAMLMVKNGDTTKVIQFVK